MTDDDGWPIDETVTEWCSGDGVVLRRHPGTEFRDGDFKPINFFGLFFHHRLVCDGTFEYVSNYYWLEFANAE